MKRVIYDVPRWHAYLHRDARGLETASERDTAVQKFEDEVFDKLYSGDLERLPEPDQDRKLKTWAEGVHRSCEELPAFSRLAAECRGEPIAAGTAVETLMAVLKPQTPAGGDEQAPENIRRCIGAACEKASQAVDELRDAAEGLGGIAFGTTTAKGSTLPASTIRSLASRLRGDGRLKQIALLAGRFKRIAAAKRRQKLKHGADEVADVEQGADLGRLLPSELVRVVHPRLRLAFMRNVVERAALQYQLTGSDTLGKGPLVVVLDKSGSMDGPRDVWATALALALLDQAHRERRTFALVCFDYQVKFEALVKPGEPLPEQGLFVACAGGTEISGALHRGLHLIEQNHGRLKKADLVLVTDGGSDTGAAPALRERARSLGATVLGVGIGVERGWLAPWCDDVHVVTSLTHLPDSTAETVFSQ